jgi:hypothetical protein
VDFFVGDITASSSVTPNSGCGPELARGWEVAIRHALMPVVQGTAGEDGRLKEQPDPQVVIWNYFTEQYLSLF